MDRERTFTLTADGTAGPYVHMGGSIVVQVVGDWGGGDVDVTMDLGSGATVEYTLTEAEPSRIFDFPANTEVNFVLAGATDPDLAIEVR